MTAAVDEVLLSAEKLGERAILALQEIATDPKHPTARETADASAVLNDDTAAAVQMAARCADEARRHVEAAARQTALDAGLEAARVDVTSQIVVGTRQGMSRATTTWLDAVTAEAPPEAAIRRTAAANAARSTPA